MGLTFLWRSLMELLFAAAAAAARACEHGRNTLAPGAIIDLDRADTAVGGEGRSNPAGVCVCTGNPRGMVGNILSMW